MSQETSPFCKTIVYQYNLKWEKFVVIKYTFIMSPQNEIIQKKNPNM